MKKLLLASLIILSVASCKKETPEPPPSNPAPAINTANFAIIDGDGHNSDTVMWTINQQAHFHNNGSYLGISANSDGFVYDILLRIPGTSTGAHTAISSSQITDSTTNYIYANVSVNVLKYESVGGIVNCNYSGTFKKQSDTTVVINVSGNFNVVRGSDL